MKLSTITLVSLVLVFLMITNSVANDDSPLVFNGTRRSAYTQSELTAVSTLSYIGVGRPTTDQYFGYIFPFVIGYDKYTDMEEGSSRVFIQRNYYLNHPEWNQYYMTGLVVGGEGGPRQTRILISGYKTTWGIDRWPLIYTNNNVTAYTSSSILPQNR